MDPHTFPGTVRTETIYVGLESPVVPSEKVAVDPYRGDHQRSDLAPDCFVPLPVRPVVGGLDDHDRSVASSQEEVGRGSCIEAGPHAATEIASDFGTPENQGYLSQMLHVLVYIYICRSGQGWWCQRGQWGSLSWQSPESRLGRWIVEPSGSDPPLLANTAPVDGGVERIGGGSSIPVIRSEAASSTGTELGGHRGFCWST